ncbi:MAG: restriction endonuclease subunit S [Magnetococcus sp. DMHC-8]
MSESANSYLRHQYQAFLQQLPVDWGKKQIAQIGTVVGGGTPSREVPSFWRGSIPWVTPGEVSRETSKFLHDTNDHISASGLAGSGANLLPAGSLMVTTRATLGARAINAVPMATNQGFKSIIFNQPDDTNYYFHLLEKVKPELVRRASGTTFLEISGAEFGSIDLPTPKSCEKLKIAQILDTLDTAIRETEAIIAKLKAVKQGMLHDLLTRGLDADGELRPPQAEAPHLYKESPLGWIPRDWATKQLGELAEVSRGKFTHRPRNDPAFFGGLYPFIQTGDVAAAQGEYVSTYSQMLSARGVTVSQEFPAGTIAVTIAANIADTAILACPMYFPDSVVGVVVCSANNIRFIELSIRRTKKTLDARAPQSAQKNINLQDLRPLLVALPNKIEQDKIAEHYEAIQSRLIEEQISVDKLRKNKSGLMDDLLTGRVRVTPLLEDTHP